MFFNLDLSLNPSPEERDLSSEKMEQISSNELLCPLSPKEKGLGIEVYSVEIILLKSA